jgi:Protein of unknown function (DUF2612)
VSGPDINRFKPGSNAIGSFTIGVSPIGDIEVFDVWKTIISQFANSPILTQLIENFDSYVDQTVNMAAFFDDMWNVDTAQGYGLDVWGRIVGVVRTLQVAGAGDYFGFAEALPGSEPFGVASFYAGAPLTSNFDLPDSSFRTLIFAKALSNISDGSVKSINQLLINLFPNRGNCFVTDGLNMSMTYTFNFVLSQVELAIIGQSGVLPKPVGVSTSIVQTA